MFQQDLPEEVLRVLPLDARSLYFFEVDALVQLSRAEEMEMAARARQGDREAKQALIESCLRYVATVAGTFYRTMPRGRDEYLDLVSVGHLAIVERFDRALEVSNPAAYLRGIAKQHIWAHCVYFSWLIQLPERKNSIGLSPDIHSLDAPIGHTDCTYQDFLAARADVAPPESQEFFQVLHRGIQEALTPVEREVVIRYYGLYGSAAHNTREVSYALTGNASSNFAAGQRLRAMAKLRRYLEKHAS